MCFRLICNVELSLKNLQMFLSGSKASKALFGVIKIDEFCIFHISGTLRSVLPSFAYVTTLRHDFISSRSFSSPPCTTCQDFSSSPPSTTPPTPVSTTRPSAPA